LDINLIIENSLAKRFMKFFKLTTANNVVRMALIILMWVMDEFEKGRVIYSVDPDGENKRGLNLPWLE